MPVKKLLVGTSKAKEVYVGTSKVKLIYVGTKCVFASPRTVTISKGTGVSQVVVAVTEKDGSTHSTTVTSSSQSIEVGYGASITMTPSASTYYTVNSGYTSSATITSNSSYSFSATRQTYTVYVRTRYNSSTSNASKVGTISGSYTNSSGSSATFSGQYSTNLTVQAGTTVSFTSYSAVAGFAAPSTKSTTITSNGQYVYADFTATTSTSSCTLSYSKSTTTNTLSKTAFSVTCTINCTLNAVSAGTSLATVPAAYRPAAAQTATVSKWYISTASGGSETGSGSATITISTAGAITSNTASSGTTTSAVGGGKWATGATITTNYYLNFSKTWSVV